MRKITIQLFVFILLSVTIMSCSDSKDDEVRTDIIIGKWQLFHEDQLLQLIKD